MQKTPAAGRAPAVIHVSSGPRHVTLQPLQLLASDRRAIWAEPLARAARVAATLRHKGRCELEIDGGEDRCHGTASDRNPFRISTGQVDVRLAGQVGYDLQRWSTRMQPLWGDQLLLTGPNNAAFQP